MSLGGHHDAAICNLLCFSSLLRIGEALHIQWNHVWMDRAGGTGVMYLPTTKSGQEAHVPLLNSFVVLLLWSWHAYQGFPRGGAVFPNVTYSIYRRVLRGALILLKLPLEKFRVTRPVGAEQPTSSPSRQIQRTSVWLEGGRTRSRPAGI